MSNDSTGYMIFTDVEFCSLFHSIFTLHFPLISPSLDAKTASLSLLFSITYTHPLNLCLSVLLWIIVIRTSPWLKFGKSWRGNRFSNQKLPRSWNPDAYLAEKCSSTMGAKMDARLYTEGQRCSPSPSAMLNVIHKSQLSLFQPVSTYLFKKFCCHFDNGLDENIDTTVMSAS